MSELPLHKSIREIIQAVFGGLGADQADRIAEVVLVRKGYIVGHRFQCGQFRIVWFYADAELKVCDAEGTLLKVVPLPEQQRRAA